MKVSICNFITKKKKYMQYHILNYNSLYHEKKKKSKALKSKLWYLMIIIKNQDFFKTKNCMHGYALKKYINNIPNMHLSRENSSNTLIFS